MADQTPDNFDMVDTPEELAAYAPEVRELLVECQPLGEYFDAANNVAVKHFRVHWWVVVLAAISGMLAVLFAIVQLEGKSLPSSKIEVMEIIAALLALTCVLLGIWAAFDRRWRLNRFLAEQCRLMKFDYLLHAGHWLSCLKEDRSKYLKNLLDELGRQTPESPRSWVLRKFNLLLGQKPKVESLTPSVLASLKNYYVTKRLSWQKGYFEKESKRRHFWERLTKHIAPLCFFLSVGAACGHFVWEIARHADEKSVASQEKHAAGQGVLENAPAQTTHVAEPETHKRNPVSLRLLLAAACLPVFGAAWRTFRGANEFGRNTNRYAAMNVELGELNTELEQAEGPEAALESLWEIERTLESEHRSWTRLMIEAEWFG